MPSLHGNKGKANDQKAIRFSSWRVPYHRQQYRLIQSQSAAQDANAAAVKSCFSRRHSKILEQSQQCTLLSLDPMDLSVDAPQPVFYGHHVYGRTQVSPKLKAQLIAALYNSMTNKHGFAAACFSPRHGIHAVLGNKAVDVLICFHCGQFIVYPNKQPNSVIISESAQPDFNQALTNAGVPLSPT